MPDFSEYLTNNLGPYKACEICGGPRVIVKDAPLSTWSRCDKCGVFRDSCNPKYYEKKDNP